MQRSSGDETILAQNVKGKRPFRRFRRRWEFNIKWILGKQAWKILIGLTFLSVGYVVGIF